jgi:hypothetical protein
MISGMLRISIGRSETQKGAASMPGSALVKLALGQKITRKRFGGESIGGFFRSERRSACFRRKEPL